MKKKEIVDVIHEKIDGTRLLAEEIVDAVFSTMKQTLARREKVLVSGFGVFYVKERTAREGVNPRTGERIIVPATVTPKFRAGQSLKAEVKRSHR